MKIAPFQIENYIAKIANEKIAGCLVFGPEESLVDYRFNLISKKISPNLSDPFSVVNLSKERISEDKLILADEFYANSMFGARKLILVRSSEAKTTDALKNLLEDNDFAKKSDNFILIAAGDLDKSSLLRKICEASPNIATIACYEDSEATIKQFIASELTKNQIKFNAQITAFLQDKFGSNRNLLLSEINKIITYLGDEKSLNLETLEKLCSFESESSIDAFVNNFANQNYQLAIKFLEKNFRDGVEAVTLIRFLSNYFTKLYAARLEIDLGNADIEQAIKNQKLFFKIEGQFRQNLNKNSLQFLVKILADLEKMEIKVKSSNAAPKLLFTAFVQKFLSQK
jgi:DNA polymerase-3 subunit delta